MTDNLDVNKVAIISIEGPVEASWHEDVIEFDRPVAAFFEPRDPVSPTTTTFCIMPAEKCVGRPSTKTLRVRGQCGDGRDSLQLVVKTLVDLTIGDNIGDPNPNYCLDISVSGNSEVEIADLYDEPRPAPLLFKTLTLTADDRSKISIPNREVICTHTFSYELGGGSELSVEDGVKCKHFSATACNAGRIECEVKQLTK